MSDKKAHSLERVIEVAAQAFSTRKFEDVSVNEISERAHCSTSTIYMSFGSKENLFLEAMKHLLDETRPGPMTEKGPSLHTLLGFAEARIRALANPARRGTIRAISSDPDLAKPLIECLAGQQCGQIAQLLNAEIVSCIEGGMLRPFEPQLIAYTIMAVTAYEPLVYGLLYGNERIVDVSKLLGRVFTPLMTAEGELQFRAYLRPKSGREAAPVGARRRPMAWAVVEQSRAAR